MCHDDPNELTSIRRTAIVVFHLAHGESLTTRQVVRLTGLRPSGARYLMRALSNVIPLYYDPAERTWQLMAMRELP